MILLMVVSTGLILADGEVQDYFTVGVSLTFGNFSFNVEHMCQHPVANFLQPITGEFDGYNKLEITFSSKKE